jgi:hypothetical protein
VNSAYEANQLSGNVWATTSGARQYHRQKTAPEHDRPVNLSELADLDAQMARFETEHNQLIDCVRKLYVMQDERSVIDYLRAHRRLPQLLVLAEPHLRKLFEEAVFSLRAATDAQGWEMLYASVQWPGDPGDVLNRLGAFDDSWWLANSSPAGNTLTFTYTLI